MKPTVVTVFLLICCSATPASPKRPPELLTGAVHCLTTKDFVPPSPAASRTFGYFLDEKSYPGQKVIYVVNYREPARSSGWVFVIWMTEHDGHQHFNIQNNASFVLAKHNFDYDGVSFVDPPLGGTWTQQHIAMAIKRIETGPRFTLDKEDFSAAMASTTCESYTENLPSHF